MAANEKVVCILCPGGLEHSGGIGRVMGYVVDSWARDGKGPAVTVLDTRGGGHILLAPIHFASTLVAILSLSLRGRLRLIHVNLSSHGSTVRKAIVISLASLLNARIIVHLHGSRFDIFYRELPSFGKRIIRWMFGRADRVIVLGKYWRDFVTSEIGGVPEDRLEVVFNGVPDPGEGHIGRPQATTAAAPLHILFLGRLGARKGVPELVSALEVLAHKGKSWRATLAGDGDVEDYRDRLQRLGLEQRVALPGWVDRKKVDELLADADIVVLPSYQENQPMSVIEGLAHQIAVVTTPVGALPDILTNRHNCLMVSPGDVQALAGALEELIDDPTLRERIAKNGRATFSEQLDVRIAATRLEKIYDEVDGGIRVPAEERAGSS